MNIPNHLKYAETHEWVEFNGTKAKVGLTDYAQSAMGDIVFVNLPDVGSEVKINQALCDVESVKAVSEAYSPLEGRITAVNEALIDSPELINQDPYNAWIAEVEFTAQAKLLDSAEYRDSIKE